MERLPVKKSISEKYRYKYIPNICTFRIFINSFTILLFFNQNSLGQDTIEPQEQTELQLFLKFCFKSENTVEFVKLFTQVLSYEANRAAKPDNHLRRRRAIYRASDCIHKSTSLHVLWHLIMHIRVVFFGEGCSFKPGWLCVSNLDNAGGGYASM